MNEFWSRRTCVILTGASKGIGQELAVEISRLLIPDSAMVLIARSTDGLENTKQMINKENKDIFVEVNNFCMHLIVNYKLFLIIFLLYYSIIALIYTTPML